jgi:RHS repeat-associated protein
VDSSDPTYYSTFDERWRNVATSRSTDANPKEFFLYHAAGTGGLGGSSHIDDMVMRDRDANTAGYAAADSTKEERRFFCQDYHHNVCAVLSDGGKIIETAKYSAYGEPYGLAGGDTNGDAAFDATDETAMGTGTGDGRRDSDQNGTINSADGTWSKSIVGTYYALGRGALSSSATGNRKGYCGYELAAYLAGAKYDIRHRWFDAQYARWLSRDPAGDVDGVDLYCYVGDAPILRTVSSGFASYITDRALLMMGPTGPCTPILGDSTDGLGTSSDILSDYNSEYAFHPTSFADTAYVGLHYGNYCGVGGSGTPIDALDTCCMQHDRCYARCGRRGGIGGVLLWSWCRRSCDRHLCWCALMASCPFPGVECRAAQALIVGIFCGNSVRIISY